MNKYTISIRIIASFEKVYKIITDLEKIKIWEPSHGLPLVAHEWIPSEGRLKEGNTLKVKSVVWCFVARCIELREDRVKWGFIDGPLKGYESWIVTPTEKGCSMAKLMEYRVPKFPDRILWGLLGRRIHDWASLRQLKSIKRLAEISK